MQGTLVQFLTTAEKAILPILFAKLALLVKTTRIGKSVFQDCYFFVLICYLL